MAATRPFVEFKLERLLSAHENEVEINLSESGVHPLTMRGLLEMKGGDLDADLAAIAATELNYPQANGDLELREAIARLVPGRDRRQRAGHGRRHPGELHQSPDGDRARRRDRRHAAQLPAVLGSRPEPGPRP